MARERINKNPPPPPEPSKLKPAEALDTLLDEPDPPPDAGDAPPAAPPASPPAGRGRGRKAQSPPQETPAAAAGDATGAPAAAAVVGSKADELARQLLDELDKPPPLPYSKRPEMGEQLAGLVRKVIDEGSGIDLESEYDYLEEALALQDALTPQTVNVAINECETNSKRAHRLFVLAKYRFERYKIEADVCLAAMRESATARLTQMKNAGQHAKQVTDSDVRDMAANMYPDEWKSITERVAATELALAHIQRFADLWQRRSWSLSSLK